MVLRLSADENCYINIGAIQVLLLLLLLLFIIIILSLLVYSNDPLVMAIL